MVGFPLNESRTRSSGYYEGELTGESRNIYNQDLAERTVLSLEVNVEPGNSGSPVLAGGRVVGVVESYSLEPALHRLRDPPQRRAPRRRARPRDWSRLHPGLPLLLGARRSGYEASRLKG